MIIECTLKRAEPVVVPIGNEKYTFELDARGRNVAEVWLESHIEAFLAVPHLYRKVDEDEPEVAAVAPAPTTEPDPALMKRPDVIAVLKARGIKFKVTESTEALRAKIA